MALVLDFWPQKLGEHTSAAQSPPVTLCFCYNRVPFFSLHSTWLSPLRSPTQDSSMTNSVHTSDALHRALMGLHFKKKPGNHFGNPILRPHDPVTELGSGLQRTHILRPHSQISKVLSLNNHTVLQSWVMLHLTGLPSITGCIFWSLWTGNKGPEAW